ncbi:MAG: hypothetical protein WB767_00805, partial [Nocardioides sp.]
IGRWVMSHELEPPMPAEHGYKIYVDGSPQITLTSASCPTNHWRPSGGDLGGVIQGLAENAKETP